MTDTLTLVTSTVMKDSLASNKSGRILVGSNYNPYSGYKSSNAYFGMIFDDDITNEKFVFDSLCMVLSYDTYYSGDTTVTQTFSIHQVTEEMVLDNGYLYTSSSFPYKDQPLATFSLKPKPNSHKNISVRLSDKFGARLAQMIKDKNDTVQTDETFVKNFFKGLVIKSNTNVKGAVIGFRTTDKSSSGSDNTKTNTKEADAETMPEFRLYYHLNPNVDDVHDLYYKFSYYSDGVSFNQVLSNTTNSFLDGLLPTYKNDERSTTLTNNCLFAQSGLPYYSKFKIPYLNKVKLADKYAAFVGATLHLYPVKGTYKEVEDLPDTLYIYSANHRNKITGQILASGSTSEYVYAIKNVVTDVEKTISYDVDISTFINSKLSESQENNLSLILGYGSKTVKNLNHVILGGANCGKYSPKLNVYYYHN